MTASLSSWVDMPVQMFTATSNKYHMHQFLISLHSSVSFGKNKHQEVIRFSFSQEEAKSYGQIGRSPRRLISLCSKPSRRAHQQLKNDGCCYPYLKVNLGMITEHLLIFEWEGTHMVCYRTRLGWKARVLRRPVHLPRQLELKGAGALFHKTQRLPTSPYLAHFKRFRIEPTNTFIKSIFLTCHHYIPPQ